MTENIRDKVRDKIAKRLYELDGGEHWEIEHDSRIFHTKEEYRYKAEQILSIEELAVVERGAQSPKCDIREDGLFPNSDFAAGWVYCREIMLKEGWVKEVRHDKPPSDADGKCQRHGD